LGHYSGNVAIVNIGLLLRLQRTSPKQFFIRDQPPLLHMGIVPLWDYAVKDMAERCGSSATAPEWRAEMAQDVQGAMIKSTSVLKASPRLLRSKVRSSRPPQ
jgi:hypothetical protein